MHILAGPDGIDQLVREKSEIRFIPPPQFKTSQVVVFDLREPFQSFLQGCSRYHPEMEAAHDEIVRIILSEFKGSKHVVLSVKEDLPELAEAFDIWASTLDVSRPQSFLKTISSCGDEVLSSCEALTQSVSCLLRCNRTCRDAKYDHTLPALGLGLLEQTVRLVPSRAKRLVESGQRLRERLNHMLGSNGILIAPSLLCPAPRHHENILRIMSSGQTGIFNVTQLPATAIPSHRRTKIGNLPLGVQAVASECNDWLCFETARVVFSHHR